MDGTAALVLLAASRLAAESHIVGVLTVDVLANWFRQFETRLETNSAKLAVTMIESAAPRRVQCLQGIFDTDTQTFDDLRRVSAHYVDTDVRRAHEGRLVAIWG